MRKLLQQFKKIVFFDTETTGLDPEKDQIIELAAALVTENGIELKIDAFCKLPEGEKIPEKIVELTHITDDMLALNGAKPNPVYFFKKVFAVVVNFARR